MQYSNRSAMFYESPQASMYSGSYCSRVRKGGEAQKCDCAISYVAGGLSAKAGGPLFDWRHELSCNSAPLPTFPYSQPHTVHSPSIHENARRSDGLEWHSITEKGKKACRLGSRT